MSDSILTSSLGRWAREGSLKRRQRALAGRTIELQKQPVDQGADSISCRGKATQELRYTRVARPVLRNRKSPRTLSTQYAREPGDLQNAWASQTGPGRRKTNLDMYVPEKSDCAIVPVNLTNKEGKTSTSQGRKGRGPRRTTPSHTCTRHRAGARMSEGLDGARKAARERKKERFTALLHHLNVDFSGTASTSSAEASPGVDGVTVARI